MEWQRQCNGLNQSKLVVRFCNDSCKWRLTYAFISITSDRSLFSLQCAVCFSYLWILSLFENVSSLFNLWNVSFCLSLCRLEEHDRSYLQNTFLFELNVWLLDAQKKNSKSLNATGAFSIHVMEKTLIWISIKCQLFKLIRLACVHSALCIFGSIKIGRNKMQQTWNFIKVSLVDDMNAKLICEPWRLGKALESSSLKVVTFCEVCMFADKQVDHKLPLQLQILQRHLKWHFF